MYGRKNVAQYEAAQPQHAQGSKHRDGSAEQDAEWQAPAFIERRENQKHEEQRESKDDR